MYNDSVIQEQSGLNAFYNKIYSLVGIGVRLCLLSLGLMMTVFKISRSNLLDNSTHGLLCSSGCRIDLGLCCKWKAVKNSSVCSLRFSLIYSA